MINRIVCLCIDPSQLRVAACRRQDNSWCSPEVTLLDKSPRERETIANHRLFPCLRLAAVPRFFTGFHAAQVGETFADVKLSDLGAARNVKSKEEYTYIATTEHLPARWLPLEAIRDAAFSHKSDVFSFGVCACGSFQPFPLSFSFIDPTMRPCWRYGCARTVRVPTLKSGARVQLRNGRRTLAVYRQAETPPAFLQQKNSPPPNSSCGLFQPCCGLCGRPCLYNADHVSHHADRC